VAGGPALDPRDSQNLTQMTSVPGSLLRNAFCDVLVRLCCGWRKGTDSTGTRRLANRSPPPCAFPVLGPVRTSFDAATPSHLVTFHIIISVLLLAHLIPSTFGGLFYLFALSLACALPKERIDAGRTTFPILEHTRAGRKEVPRLSPESVGEKAFLYRRFYKNGSGSKRVPWP
jgi:hypothetical protein